MKTALFFFMCTAMLAGGCGETEKDPSLGAVDGVGLDGLTAADTGSDEGAVADAPDAVVPTDGMVDGQPEIAADTPVPQDGNDDSTAVDVTADVSQEETTDATDASEDTGIIPDAPDGLQGDGGLGDVSLIDSGEPDIAATDTPPELESDGPGSDALEGCPGTPECFLPQPGAPDAPVNQPAGAAPTLAGGAKPEGWFELEAIDIYTDGTFNGLVTNVTVSSNGNTYGAIEVTGDSWGISANLDLALSVQPLIGDAIAQSFALTLSGGGCFVLNGATIEADLLQCGGSFANGIAPPDAFPFETSTGELAVMVTIDQAAILSLLPAEYQDLAGLALAGDLPMVLRFVTP